MSETLNAQDIAKKLQEQLTSLSATVDTHEVSTVDEVGDGIARVSGLKSAMAGELLEFKSSDTGETVFGLAQNLDRDEVGAVLFGAVDSIKEGDECRTTGRIMDIPVSRAMLGRVVNPLGQPIDGLGDIVADLRRHFAVEIVVTDKSLCDETYYASFVNEESLDEILDALNKDRLFSVRREAEVYYISPPLK
jgi:F-type H+-transporting ATPase subunit alpha